jgi:uncharacterized PurR-regulated membrane protein YhhQ (DUF165 family)
MGDGKMFLITLYLTAIVLANLTVTWFGPSVTIVNAFVLIALDLSSRDTLHERWAGRGLWWRMILLIATGSALSYLLNAGAARIALASFAAFGIASIFDTLVYVGLYKRSYMVKSNGSNLVSAAVDSLVFPALAFGWPPLWGIVIGQFAAKIIGGYVWSVILSKRQQQTTYAV